MKHLPLLMLLGSFALPFVAQAQTGSSWTAERWNQIADQAVKNLESEYPAIREQGLKNVIYLAQEHAYQVSVEKAVKPLIEIFENETDAQVRDLALAALESIRNERARRYIRANVPLDKMAQTRELIASVVSEQVAQMSRG